MMRVKNLHILLLTLLGSCLFLGDTGSVRAQEYEELKNVDVCECEILTGELRREQADVVFLAIAKGSIHYQPNILYQPFEVVYQEKSVANRPLRSKQRIFLFQEYDACSIFFDIGQFYMIYGNVKEVNGSEVIFTNRCAGTEGREMKPSRPPYALHKNQRN
mgnify:CR=1 FL=1